MRSPSPWLLLLLVATPLLAKEVTEPRPDGSLKSRYLVDEQGRRTGSYTEFHPNGQPSLQAHYDAGVLQGSYADFHPNGRTRVEASFRAGSLDGAFRSLTPEGALIAKATYRKGLLDGKCTFYLQGKPCETQVWKDGVLQALEGIPSHPRPLATIRERLASILGSQEGTPSSPQEARARALRLLQAYRFLCEAPYEGMSLDDEYNRCAEAAADICRRNRQLSHHPPNPGLPEEEFRLASRGASHGNLHTGPSSLDIMERSVDGYMDDSDPSNIDRLGHRRWCLNPSMLKTGFGASEGYTGMWSMDAGRAKIPDYDVVAYPPKGYVPIRYFSSHHAWSLSPNPSRYPPPKEGEVHVKVFPVDEHYRKAAEPLPMDYFKISLDAFGSGPCVIFRPKGIEASHGKRYWVEVEGLAKKAAPLKFLVEFVDLNAAPTEAKRPEPAEGYWLPVLPPFGPL